MHDRLGKLDLLEHDRRIFVAQGVSCRGVLQTHHSDDITCVHFLQLGTIVGVHLEQSRNTLSLSSADVVDVGTGGQRTGIDADEGKSTDKGVGHDLEGQRRERCVVFGFAHRLFFAVRLVTRDGGHV